MKDIARFIGMNLACAAILIGFGVAVRVIGGLLYEWFWR
jgi:hypothetical protein